VVSSLAAPPAAALLFGFAVVALSDVVSAEVVGLLVVDSADVVDSAEVVGLSVVDSADVVDSAEVVDGSVVVSSVVKSVEVSAF